MIAYMKILLATSEEFIATSLLNHTNLLLPFATPSDKVSNLLICMIVSRLIYGAPFGKILFILLHLFFELIYDEI